MNSLTALLAEVADKEPTLPKLWIVAIVLSGASLLLGFWRRWAALIPAAAAAIWAYTVWSELNDRFVGPAIRQELGDAYIAQSYVTTLLPFLYVVFVFLRETLERSNQSLQPTAGGCTKKVEG